ncbi:MAG TPA: hypothetical protein VHS53_09700, partial [Mucilaginibacter sp.]|nr:hypothetical protein [Mucilaginibacter sp.]
IPQGINTGGLLVTVNGTSALPIVFTSYGTGAKPIITLPAVTGWVPGATAGIYTTRFTIQTCCSLMFQDGVPITKASSSALTDGNWYGDGTTLYYKPTSGTTANHTLAVSNINNSYIPGIDLSARQYVVVNNIQFNGLGIGVRTFGATPTGEVGLVVQSCTFNYCQSGIFFMPDVGNNTKSTFQNNLFYRCQVGIRMYTTAAVGGTYATRTTGTHINCRILNNEMSQCGTTDGTTHWQSSVAGTDFEAIGVQNFVGGTISNNYIHDGYCIGISWYNISTRSSDNNTITGNAIMNNLKGGLIMIGSAAYNYGYNNNLFANNLFVNSNGGPGSGDGTIAIYPGTLTTVNSKFVNNTLSGSLNNIAFENSNAPYFTIENNIISTSGQYNFVTWHFSTKPASLTMDYNLYYQSGTGYWAMSANKTLAQMQAMGLETHSKVANPMFVNTTGNQFQLQSTSPALNAGVNVGLSYYGAAPDMGAYELASGTAVSATVVANPPKKP